VNDAVAAAERVKTQWRRTPPGDRVQYLFALKQLLEDHIDELARPVVMENGKTFAEAKGEVRRAIENVEVACGIPMLMQGYNLEDISPGIDESMLRQVKKDSSMILAPSAVAKELSGEKVTVINNGETKTVGKWTIQAVPMYNLKRGPSEGQLFHDKGRGNGYILTYGGTRFYIAGDTEGIPEMRALKNIDVAFIPMNLPYTMPPEEAADAVKAFKPKIVYPYHYMGSDLKVFESALKGSGVEVRIRDWYTQ